jgi:hypothetical protein
MFLPTRSISGIKSGSLGGEFLSPSSPKQKSSRFGRGFWNTPCWIVNNFRHYMQQLLDYALAEGKANVSFESASRKSKNE